MTDAIADIPSAQELAELFAQPRRDPPPEPGIYMDVEMETYLAWDAVSASGLGEIAKSPAHARAKTEEAEEVGNDDAVASIVGTASHTAVLEPEKFESKYVRGPAGNWTHKANKDAKAELQAKYPRATILKPFKYDAILKARDAIRAHPAAGGLLARAACIEMSIVWDDPATGLRCKARPDFLIPELGVICDLKSAIDAGRRGFARAIANFGYHRKAAFYIDGMNALSTDTAFSEFAFIAFEKMPPYAVAVYQLDSEAIDIGRRLNRLLMQSWKECHDSGVWPAYPDDITYIGVPEWAQYEGEDL